MGLKGESLCAVMPWGSKWRAFVGQVSRSSQRNCLPTCLRFSPTPDGDHRCHFASLKLRQQPGLSLQRSHSLVEIFVPVVDAFHALAWALVSRPGSELVVQAALGYMVIDAQCRQVRACRAAEIMRREVGQAVLDLAHRHTGDQLAFAHCQQQEKFDGQSVCNAEVARKGPEGALRLPKARPRYKRPA